MLRGNNMNYDDLKKFYSKDKKEYDLYHNLEFLKWFNMILKNGYSSYLNLSALQSFINKLSMWYEYKYPERKLIMEEGFVDKEFDNILDISKNLDYSQLRYQLSYNELKLLDSVYRSNNGYSVIDKNKKTNNYITFNIYKKQISKEFVEDNIYKLSAIDTTGKIKNEDIVNLFPKEKNMTIEDLYKLLRDNHDYDIEELQNILFIHNMDIELRSKILYFTMKKLIYSKRTTPKRGYNRAIYLMKDFNNYIKKLNLVSISIDKIMEDDYIVNKNNKFSKFFKDIKTNISCYIYRKSIKRKIK